MWIEELATPALVVEHPRLLRNLEAMRRRMAGHGVALRPHVKTAKSARIARLCHGDRTGPLTVSTLREAEYFLDHGFTDLTYAVGIVADKLERVAALRRRGAELKIVTDNVATAQAIAGTADRTGQPFQVMIEVDCGGLRAGVRPDDAELLEIAAALTGSDHVRLAGVLTHAGHSYHCRSLDEIKEIAAAERAAAVEAAGRLRTAGHPCPVVSAGSTPTAVHAERLEGLTEMRPGVYVFFDLDQWAIGSCGRDDIALSVLASVTGHNRHAGHLLLDAGGLALSKDTSANEFRPELGYGQVCDAHSLQPIDGLCVKDVHQEHGIVPVSDPALFERLPIGARVRVLPNHACMTAAAYDSYQVVAAGELLDRWERVNGW